MSQAVSILGMHRSGTSMVAEILSELGVFLGDPAKLLPPVAEDNAHGYFENEDFDHINEGILGALGGSWDSPPNRFEMKDVLQFRARALALVGSLASRAESWGWKDPRTCLTLPFWMELVPEAKFVLCVRHPVEVAQSFAKRQHGYLSREHALQLWTAYNQAALQALPQERTIVTHYVSYQFDAKAEIERVAAFLGLDRDPEAVSSAAGKVDPGLWHGFDGDLGAQAGLYKTLCDRAGPVFEASLHDRAFQDQLNEQRLAKALERIDALETLNNLRLQELGELRTAIRDLKGELSILGRARMKALTSLRALKRRLRSG